MSQRVIKTHSKSSNRVVRVRETKKPTRFFSKQQETAIAEDFGGKRQPNSGATPFAKGDVTLDKFLIECKTRTKSSDSISIKKEWIEKLVRESLFEGKENWSLAFNFGPNEPNYYIIDGHLFDLLVRKFVEE